jgi:hypothetical protein
MVQTHLAVSGRSAPHSLPLVLFLAPRILARIKNRARQILARRFRFLRERLIMGTLDCKNLFGDCCAQGAADFPLPRKISEPDISSSMRLILRATKVGLKRTRRRCLRLCRERRTQAGSDVAESPRLPAGPADRYTFCLLNLFFC